MPEFLGGLIEFSPDILPQFAALLSPGEMAELDNYRLVADSNTPTHFPQWAAADLPCIPVPTPFDVEAGINPELPPLFYPAASGIDYFQQLPAIRPGMREIHQIISLE